MDLNNRVYCHWDLLIFLNKEHLQGDKEGKTLSVIDGADIELMIFLQRMLENGYEVNVYADEEKFDHFELESFEKAMGFVKLLPINHPQYTKRPAKKKSLK